MKKILATLAVLAPSVAFAQSNQINDFNSLTVKLTNIGTTIISILIALGVIYIVWNAVQFIMAADNADKRKEKGQALLYGIVGLFVILSIWGLVAILTGTFSTQNTAPVNQFPQVKTFVTGN
ncbi:MAG: hypothetical protein KGI49_00995 [Patescibacteria group bacterium]|nr:hypothetical protein [Patescibacteria group bacterium]